MGIAYSLRSLALDSGHQRKKAWKRGIASPSLSMSSALVVFQSAPLLTSGERSAVVNLVNQNNGTGNLPGLILDLDSHHTKGVRVTKPANHCGPQPINCGVCPLL
jgi:hypothetical protein